MFKLTPTWLRKLTKSLIHKLGAMFPRCSVQGIFDFDCIILHCVVFTIDQVDLLVSWSILGGIIMQRCDPAMVWVASFMFPLEASRVMYFHFHTPELVAENDGSNCNRILRPASSPNTKTSHLGYGSTNCKLMHLFHFCGKTRVAEQCVRDTPGSSSLNLENRNWIES